MGTAKEWHKHRNMHHLKHVSLHTPWSSPQQLSRASVWCSSDGQWAHTCSGHCHEIGKVLKHASSDLLLIYLLRRHGHGCPVAMSSSSLLHPAKLRLQPLNLGQRPIQSTYSVIAPINLGKSDVTICLCCCSGGYSEPDSRASAQCTEDITHEL